MKKTVLLIVAYQDYQPIEYGHTRKTLEQAGITVKVASNKAGTAQAAACKNEKCESEVERHAEYAHAPVDVSLENVDATEYDGIFIIGGGGAIEYLDNAVVYKIMQKIAQLQKPFGAICVSPRILAHAGLLNGKKATGWDGDHELDGVFNKHSVQRVPEGCVTDGNIITADGPRSAGAFGKAIIKLLQ